MSEEVEAGSLKIEPAAADSTVGDERSFVKGQAGRICDTW